MNRPDPIRAGAAPRFFDYGELKHVVLALIAEQPRHGYDIIRAVEQRTRGAYCPSPGVIYPTLSLLEDLGQVEAAAGDGPRNRYRITNEGRAFLAENKSRIDDIFARMQHAGSARAAAAPDIVAAMDELKAALHSGPRPWSAEEAKRVAAIIDEAATRIRRLRTGKNGKK